MTRFAESPRMRKLLFAGVASLVTAAVYLPSCRYWFVSLDDPYYVIWNEHMRKGLTAESVKWAFTSRTYASNWHPLCWISLLADVNLVGGERLSDAEWSCPWNRLAKGMHTHNVVLHAVNAALLFALMGMLCGWRLDLKWLLALTLAWSLHPLRVEVVCWVAERKELLSVFFMLLTMIFYIGGSLRRSSLITYHLSLITYAAAAASKPVAVSLPAVLIAYDWIFRGRPRILAMLPFVVLSGLTCVLTLGAQTEAIECGIEGGIAQRLAAIFGSPLVYIRQTVLPYGLSAAYEVSASIDWPLVLGGALFAAGLVAVGVLWLVRRVRTGWRPGGPTLLDFAAFAVAWCYVGLMPMLGIVKVGWQEHSDRYTYWIGCGACATLAMVLAARGCDWWEGVVRFIEKTDGRPFDRAQGRRFFDFSAIALVVALAFMTNERMACWRNSIAYLRDAVPKCWQADFVSAASLMLRGAGPGCAEEAERIVREYAIRKPGVDSSLMLAKFLIRRRPPVEAEYLLRGILAENPDHGEARELLEGLERERRGEVSEQGQGGPGNGVEQK